MYTFKFDELGRSTLGWKKLGLAQILASKQIWTMESSRTGDQQREKQTKRQVRRRACRKDGECRMRDSRLVSDPETDASDN